MPPRFNPSAARSRWALAVTAVMTVSAAAAAAALIGLHSPSAEANPAPAAPAAVPVSVAIVASQPVATWAEFSGRLEAVDRVEVRPRVSGVLQAVHFKEGALVPAGALLLSLDAAPYQAELARAEAQVQAARARQGHAQAELERARRLWTDRAIAQRELDERGQASREADAQLMAAQAAWQLAQLNLSYTQVRAPVAGRVGRLEVTPGNLVAAGAGAPVLTTLVSVQPIYASFDADERTVMRLLADLPGGAGARQQLTRIPVQVGTGEGGQAPHLGRLQLVDNQVQASSGTVRVRAVLDNADGALMPGQFARVRLGQARSEPAVLVHERAVGTDQNKRYVLVVGADQTLSYREITLGEAVDGLRIVSRGLSAGEQVVVNGLQRVRPGAKVQPRVVPMQPAPLPASAPERA